MNRETERVHVTLRRGDQQLELTAGGKPLAEKPKKKKHSDPILAALARVPWVAAPEVADLADELIPLHHTERWYVTPQILYFFCEKAPKAGGFDRASAHAVARRNRTGLADHSLPWAAYEKKHGDRDRRIRHHAIAAVRSTKNELPY